MAYITNKRKYCQVFVDELTENERIVLVMMIEKGSLREDIANWIASIESGQQSVSMFFNQAYPYLAKKE